MIHNSPTRVITPILAANKRFGAYKGETEHAVRKSEPKCSEGLRNIIEAWEVIAKFPSMAQLFHDISNPCYYTREAIEGKTYTAEDITAFSVMIPSLQDERAFAAIGQFLSTLINEGKEDEYRIITRGITYPINHLGYENKKRIIIEGDAGGWLGREMRSGSILVKGNAGDAAGSRLIGGSIVIEGDAGHNVGETMFGGTVTVKGNAGLYAGYDMYKGSVEIMGSVGDDAGYDMEGGTLVIHGDCGDSVGRGMKGGLVTVKGNTGDFAGGYMERGGPALQNPMFGWYNPMSMPLMKKHGTFLIPEPPRHDGKIIIYGNAGEGVGNNMPGNTMRIYGDIRSLGHNIGGKIYHKDILIAGNEI